jgi:outer membrane protein assembly factor BamE (lipoprotein component of BamABCDE complex)
MRRKDLGIILFLAIIAGGSFLMAGCESGNKRIVDNAFTEQIKIGQTTKAEVIKILGKPEVTSKNSSNGEIHEIWCYTYNKDKVTFPDVATFGIVGALIPQHSDIYSFVITFSEDGIVQNITKSEMSI